MQRGLTMRSRIADQLFNGGLNGIFVGHGAQALEPQHPVHCPSFHTLRPGVFRALFYVQGTA